MPLWCNSVHSHPNCHQINHYDHKCRYSCFTCGRYRLSAYNLFPSMDWKTPHLRRGQHQKQSPVASQIPHPPDHLTIAQKHPPHSGEWSASSILLRYRNRHGYYAGKNPAHDQYLEKYRQICDLAALCQNRHRWWHRQKRKKKKESLNGVAFISRLRLTTQSWL